MAETKNKGTKKELTPAQRAALDAGRGRTKGSRNKTTTMLKDALLLAATEAGGKDGLVGYLKKQALENPQSFLPQLGKVLPLQLTGEGGGPVTFTTIYEARDER